MLEIKEVKIAELIPATYNPRKLSKEQYNQIKRSLTKFNMIEPIIANKDKTIIGGHQRCKVWSDMGHDTIPVVFLDVTKEEERELNIRLNKNTGEWDFDILANEFELNDLYDWGFTPEEFNITQLEPEAVEDNYEIPDTIETDIVRGDIFEIGPHRLMCGDSTMIDDVEKLMNGEKAEMMMTDIPYSISQKSNGLRQLDYGEWDKNVESIGEDVLYPSIANSYYVFCGDEQLSGILKKMSQYGMMTRCFVWHKTNPTVLNGDKLWLPSQELCAYGKISGATFNEHCSHAFYEGSPDGTRLHPNQKPIKLIEKCIKASSIVSNIIIDIFLGSGTTMVASHQLNRKCYGMELDPKYCQVIVDRMLKLDPSLEVKRNGQPYQKTSR